jgi:hypothetical protein
VVAVDQGLLAGGVDEDAITEFSLVSLFLGVLKSESSSVMPVRIAVITGGPPRLLAAGCCSSGSRRIPTPDPAGVAADDGPVGVLEVDAGRRRVGVAGGEPVVEVRVKSLLRIWALSERPATRRPG